MKRTKEIDSNASTEDKTSPVIKLKKTTNHKYGLNKDDFEELERLCNIKTSKHDKSKKQRLFKPAKVLN